MNTIILRHSFFCHLREVLYLYIHVYNWTTIFRTPGVVYFLSRMFWNHTLSSEPTRTFSTFLPVIKRNYSKYDMKEPAITPLISKSMNLQNVHQAYICLSQQHLHLQDETLWPKTVIYQPKYTVCQVSIYMVLQSTKCKFSEMLLSSPETVSQPSSLYYLV